MTLRLLVIVGGALASLAVPGAALASYTTGPVHLRTGPSTSSAIITTAQPGAWVSVQFCSHSWCKVKLSAYTGWMSSGHIGGSKPRYSRYRVGVEARARPQRSHIYQPYRSYRPSSNYSIDLSLGSRSWR
jgi:uncharacterized protein YraI